MNGFSTALLACWAWTERTICLAPCRLSEKPTIGQLDICYIGRWENGACLGILNSLELNCLCYICVAIVDISTPSNKPISSPIVMWISCKICLAVGLNFTKTKLHYMWTEEHVRASFLKWGETGSYGGGGGDAAGNDNAITGCVWRRNWIEAIFSGCWAGGIFGRFLTTGDAETEGEEEDRPGGQRETTCRCASTGISPSCLSPSQSVCGEAYLLSLLKTDASVTCTPEVDTRFGGLGFLRVWHGWFWCFI